MTNNLSFDDKIGVLDPEGINNNPLTGQSYSQTYKELGAVWSKFPAFDKAKEVIDTIINYQLTFIISSTGSGKTVLIPKLALHYTNYKGKIAVILPKRIVTLSAAVFSAKTLDVELGVDVGYVYKGSPKNALSSKNKIIYMTTGVIIMNFVNDPLLSNYSVIIVDEAHERRTEIDLILLFLKNLLKSGKRSDLKVIIMSATIDGPKYQKYYDGIPSKIINISGLPNYEITTHFLDSPTRSYLETGLNIIDKLVSKPDNKSILFFLTTSNETLQLCKSIRPKYPNVYCIEVYADMDKTLKIYAESSDKYLELGKYDHKVIMATNVAESSITIDGLKYVIDSCHELYDYFHPEYCGNILKKKLITKAQALQRRGRVGRTSPGTCYHLVTKEQFDSLKDYPDPDILKQDITLDMLKIIQLTNSQTFHEGYELLNQLMDPPKIAYIQLSRNLYHLYNIIDSKGKLTKLGRQINSIGSLPFNRILFLIYSYELHCAKEASIIIAMLEMFKGKLNNVFFKEDTICKSDCKKTESKELIRSIISKKSDHLTFLKLYKKFKEADDRNIWAAKYGVKKDMLDAVTKLSQKYFSKMMNISKISGESRVNNSKNTINTEKNLIKALIMSHKHLIAKKMTTIYPPKKIEGIVNKDSILYYNHSKKDLENKTFIYDELSNVSDIWEYNLVTIIN